MQNKERLKTLIFVVVAGLFVGVASLAHFISKPQPIEGFEREGELFYPDFDDPNNAVSLEVIAFNSNKTGIKSFVIKQEEGAWVILPHRYPADAKVRFAKTAASIIGIKRGALVSRQKSDHKKYQVGDPLQFDSDNSDALPLGGVGNRIRLKGKGETVLADFIIGKEHPKRKGLYYIRHPREDAIWLSQIEIDISTKFSDWINSDLLGISSNDVRSIEIKRYSFNKKQGRPKREETNQLSRTSEQAPWELKGINKKTEEIQSSHLSELLDHLTRTKIVGVRRKPQGLNADLSVDQEIIRSQEDLIGIQIDFAEKGFFIGRDQNEKLILLSNEGEVVASTKEGVAYDLYFGKLFTGTEYDIEIGFTTKEKTEKEKEKPPKEDLKKSRYLFVTARFDLDALGKIPVKPEKPPEPKKEEKQSKEKPKTKGKEKQKEEPKSNAKKPVEKKSPDGKKKPEEKKKKTTTQEDAYQKALDQYNSDLLKYQKENKEYKQKIEEGLKKVAKLNKHFGQWYYVISAESFENLRLARKDLVKLKEKKEEKTNSPKLPKGSLPPDFKIPALK